MDGQKKAKVGRAVKARQNILDFVLRSLRADDGAYSYS